MEWSGVELGGLVGMEGDACRGWWVGLWQGVGRGRGVQKTHLAVMARYFAKLALARLKKAGRLGPFANAMPAR